MSKRICILQDIAPDFNFEEVFNLSGESICAKELQTKDFLPSRTETNHQKTQILSVYTGQKSAKCRGCFGCWLKTPGECVLHDGNEWVGSALMSSDKVYILSRCCYGGFSVETKRILDRCIPGVLPFFRYIHWEMHHIPRHRCKPEYHIAFYQMGNCTKQEKETAVKAAKAMAVNFHAKNCRVTLFDHKITAEEAANI